MESQAGPIRVGVFVMLLLIAATAHGQSAPARTNAPAALPALPGVPSINQTANPSDHPANPLANPLTSPLQQLPDLSSRENFSAAMQIIILLTVLSLAPAILIMMTSFTRIIIVLSLLRQALGTQQLPPNQILVGLALFMTFLIMGPTWQRVNNDALQPYMNGTLDQPTALQRAQTPLRQFMINQIQVSGNEADVLLFIDYMNRGTDAKDPQTYDEVGTMTLIPAFVLSELKTAFLLGFKVYLPFLIIDMVISSILISMSMMMLPPMMISLPFKLLLFVLVDGWHLITGSLMGSFSM